ncbi:MAG TPA: class I SAM-dependent methyltransferase [Armatimonadota bacterium]|jgi:cyclopropane fatty-acyl-phospholipid synthase-like methyltransferase
MVTVARWQAYWEDKSQAGFRYENEDHYQRCAAELRVLFHQLAPQSVLEIGCGNGALYEYLGFKQSKDYHGVDFSQSMLNVFQAHYPTANLICADGAAYRVERTYDLIFSNGVLQHFDRKMLEQHFENARAMMTPDSLFVCASIPWKALWYRYLSGELTGEAHVHRLRGVILRAMRACSIDGMGYWYEHDDFKRLATRMGMTASFHGCIYYPYRFHVVLQLRQPGRLTA